MFTKDDLIFAYTRKQAIQDGVLRDVSKLAKEVGFIVPVALTASVWSKFVKVPDGVTGQDETGRLWDVLWMCHVAIVKQKPEVPILHFTLLVSNRSGPKKVTLKAILGPDDEGKACLTILLPEED